MRYEENVLRDYITELRTAQLLINTKPELDGADMDLIAECLNRCEILTMSLLGSQVELAKGKIDVGVGEEFNFEQLSPEEIAQRISEAFNGSNVSVIFPEDLFSEDDAEVQEKYDADQEPKVKS